MTVAMSPDIAATIGEALEKIEKHWHTLKQLLQLRAAQVVADGDVRCLPI